MLPQTGGNEPARRQSRVTRASSSFVRAFVARTNEELARDPSGEDEGSA